MRDIQAKLSVLSRGSRLVYEYADMQPYELIVRIRTLQTACKDGANAIAQLEAELSTVKEGRKLYKEIADEAIAERDALKAERDALKLEAMERAAEIAETDTFAPPYGKRIADAIRAELSTAE